MDSIGEKRQTNAQASRRLHIGNQTLVFILTQSGVKRHKLTYCCSGAGRFLQQTPPQHQAPGWYRWLTCLRLRDGRREGNSGGGTRLHNDLPLCLFAFREEALKSKCKQSQGRSQQRRERLRTVIDHEKIRSLPSPADLAHFPSVGAQQRKKKSIAFNFPVSQEPRSRRVAEPGSRASLFAMAHFLGGWRREGGTPPLARVPESLFHCQTAPGHPATSRRARSILR